MGRAETALRHAPTGPRPVVEAEGLGKRYGDADAVSDLTLDIAAGTIFGFIGPSGSGKTTTTRMLAGITEPSAGQVRVFGAAPTSFSPRERARVGYMPQLSVLYPNLSLRENLNFVASIYGMRLRRRSRLRQVLDFVELWDDRRKLLRETSGGMQRRLALAATLLHDPELLFLDEPTAGIDPVLRRKFWDHFEGLRDAGRTLCVTTQYVGEAAYCDLVAVLSEGRLLTVDTPDGLRRQAFGGQIVDLAASQPLDERLVAQLADLPIILSLERLGADGRVLRVRVDRADTALPRLAEWLDDRAVRVESLREHVPPFDDVFVQLVQKGPARV